MLLLSDRPVSASVWDSLLPVDRNILNFSYQVFATCLPSVCPKSQYSQMCLPICFTYFMYISILLEFWVLFFSFAYALPWIRINFPHSSLDKESACNARDLGSIPGLGRALEKEMATHSNILAWRISWTEEPRGLLSMGSQESDMLSD